ncbi:hypothetical protein M422DRAFT_253853 [Sphaerobolus stellatus SS14]|uniref:Uncharacterized protein n=1 Tax=Sphaerobolus stellatus (strain SS14) TaxID=990650 RepID=A0A0C9VWN6_SPHS4|nr:hypothetical protein M422DRAFT_253853 [Sphaerobolus stellatus SS14]
MDQDESDPELTLSQPPAGSSSLADRLDYGGGSLAHPLLMPKTYGHGTIRESTAELTAKLYADNLEPIGIETRRRLVEWWEKEYCANRMKLTIIGRDYGEGSSFSRPPADAHELRARISYYDSLVPQGTARESTVELTEELTRDFNNPASDREDDDDDLGGFPTIAEGILQDVPSCPPAKLAHPVGKSNRNNSKVVHEAGIPAIGGSRLPPTPKRIIADPPASITRILPRPLGKSRAEGWDQPTLTGASDWVMESDVHDSEMCRLYIEGRVLQPHKWSSDHTAVIFRIDEYAKSLPRLPRGLMVHPDDPDWMINVIQTFNANPSGIPRNL